MSEGQIVKAISGYYDVLEFETERIWRCRARGLFRKKGMTPLVGDYVQFESSTPVEGTVTAIRERKNELLRPPVANIDQAVLVFSIAEPVLNLPLLDRFLVLVERAGMEALICLSKADLDEGWETSYPELQAYTNMGYTVLMTSAEERTGIVELARLMQSKTNVVAGQSGVGKSTLLNRINPDFNLDTQHISAKLGRGRHTTRHVELLPLEGGGFVADTPGFSQVDFGDLEPEDLGGTFRDFAPFIPSCKFRGCLHVKEPQCAVKQALERGDIAEHRYRNYVQFLQEINENHRKRYS
jgi:ribosome biogenesis GTPase / thiamine phosphate phosphatase